MTSDVSALSGLRRVVILGLLGTAWLTGCGSSAPVPDDQGKAIAEAFLSKVRSGNADAAWETTTAEFKSLMGKESFRGYVKKQPLLKTNTVFESASVLEQNGLKLVQCQFKAEAGKGGAIKVTLAPKADGWQVERLSVE